jgi:hypothetical protein
MGLMLAVMTFGALASIQVLCWWNLYGSFLTIPQGQSFMRWARPYIGQTLFSGWHGLYYWHPALLLASVGLVAYALRNRDKITGLALLACLGAMTYVNACVSDWHAGASFGARRFCCLLPVFAIGLAALFARLGRRRVFFAFAIAGAFVAWNVLVCLGYSRGMYDMWFVSELWPLRNHLARWTPGFLWSLSVSSYPLSRWFFDAAYLEGALLILIEVLLIGVLALAFGRVASWRVGRTAGRGGIALIGLGLIADVLLFVSSPPVDDGDLLFGQMIANASAISHSEKVEIVTDLIARGTDNPAVYYCAVEDLGLDDSLPQYLTAVHAISPHVWTQWRRSLPEELRPEGPPGDGEEVDRPRFRDPWAVFMDRASRARQEGDVALEKAWLERALRYHPFELEAIKRLAEVHDATGDPARARALKQRMRDHLEAKFASYLAHEQGVVPGIYREDLLSSHCYGYYAKELAVLYEEEGETDRALNLWREIGRRDPGAAGRVRRSEGGRGGLAVVE